MTRPIPLEELTDASGKAAGLHFLHQAGFDVPATWVIPPDSQPPYEVDELLARGGPFAVRSSASVEDGSERSFAGQFASVLDVPAQHAALIDAIEEVRASGRSERAQAYADVEPEMAVIIQDMVRPIVSGVAFSKNPVTGLGETVIEAVRGRGDQLVSEGATPDRWVRRWGDYVEAPADSDIDPSVIDAVAELTQAVADARGNAVDIEWVWDGDHVRPVQVRPITGLDEIGVYSNRISKEVMPGLIKPLVWSVNVPVVNRAWIELFTEAVGPNDLTPADLAKQFGYRSYFDMGTIGDIFELLGMPRSSLENLLGLPEGSEQPKFKPSATTIRKTPRLLALAMRKAWYGRTAERIIPALRRDYARFDGSLVDLSDDAILGRIDELMELGTRAAYANIVLPLLANVTSGLLRRRLAKHDVDLSAIDLTRGVDGFEELDPNAGLDRLAEELEAEGPAESVEDLSPRAAGALRRFLSEFGHFSDSGNDFSVAPWREQPEMVLRVATARVGETTRQGASGWDAAEAHVSVIGRPAMRALRNRAVTAQLRREAISSAYTYGYGLFRNHFLELGRRLVERERLDRPDDVMYLDLAQLRDVVRGGDLDARAIVAHHRAEMDRVADLEMPEVIYGDDFVPVRRQTGSGVYQGVATSRGRYRGSVRVVTGMADFDRVDEGDVLAIPYSDVGWTPLFRRAGAVVAESGGMLSHSSIVAREYGIPCVVSVAGAMSLPDGAIVVVDGFTGEVVLE